MKKPNPFLATAVLFAAVICSPPMAQAKTPAFFSEFMHHPTGPVLPKVKEACDSSQIASDDLESLARFTKKHPSILRVRALAYVREHCSDAAVSEDISGLLGVELLTTKTEYLVVALALEKPSPALLTELGKTEGPSGESPFIDCDKSCLPKVEKFFAGKIKALKALKYTDEQTPIQQALIAGAQKGLEDWRKRPAGE